MSELELWNELGNIYYNSGAYNKAIRTCQKVIELDPSCGLPYSNLASIYVCQGRYAEAIPMFQKSIELLDKKLNKGFLWRQLGDAYRKLEDHKNAYASYQKALEFDPQDTKIQERLVELELSSPIADSESLTDTDQNAIPSFKPDEKEGCSPESVVTEGSQTGNACWVFKNNEPNQQDGYESSDACEQSPVILGVRILTDSAVEEDDAGKLDTAEERKTPDQIPVEVSCDSSSTEIVNMPVNGLADGNLTVDSQDAIEFDFNKEDTNGMLRLGILHWRKKEYERGFQFIKIALDTAGRSQNHLMEALCHYAIAQVETDMGKFEDAIQSYQSAANLAPERIFPWNNLGNLNCTLGHYEDARVAFQDAIEHDPKDPVSWNGLGDVYHKLGCYEDAIAAYQLGNAFEKQGPEEDIFKEYEKNIDSDQGNPQFWHKAGNIYFDTGAYDDAINAYRRAIELDPENATFQSSLVKAEQAREDANATRETPTLQSLNEENLEALPQSESLSAETADPQAGEIKMPQIDSTVSESGQKTGAEPEKLSGPSDSAAYTKPEASYWMFKKDNPHGKAHQPAAQNHPRATEILMNTVNQLPTFTLGADHDQAFPGNQVLQDTGNDCASLLVQLTPRPIKPAGEEEIASDPGAKHDLETASKEVKSVLHNPPSTKPWISAEESALQPSKTKNPAADQSWLDSKIHENDITAYRRVTELNPKNDRAWDALGNIYQSAGLHNEAAEAFEQAITLDPQREAYHYHLGIALGYLNQYAKAIQALNKVIELNPKYVLAHCALAGYYRKLGRETEVQEHIKIARPSMENENEYNQACFESISGDADRAIALLEIALEKQQIKQDMVRSDPDLDFIRKDSRFEALLAKNSIS